jgi:Family of unknown function (DUF6152)
MTAAAFPTPGGCSMRIACAVLVVALALHLTSGSLRAHHSFAAEFDAKRPFKMSGIVTKIEWQNPHTFFYIDVTDNGGKVTNWGMEMGSPNGLMRNGWTRNTLKIGDVVSVEGSLARDNKPIGNARVVILSATGQRLFAASSQDTTP